MQYLIGAVIATAFFICLFLSFYLGTRYKKHVPVTLSPEDKRKQEQLQREFKEIMGYNLTKALEGRR